MYANTLYIDYYGVVSQSSEANILKMAQDIFYTQLKSIENISVDDKRLDSASTLQVLPDFSATVSPHLVFYAEITEDATNAAKEWLCTFTVLQTESEQRYTKTERYASYYKILVNAKLAIEDVLGNFMQRAPLPAAATAAPAQNTAGVKLESLAGTWTGDSDIDKAILLRGGKGFVIFKNGASMNVKVLVTAHDAAGNVTGLQVIQDAKPNASFFPELSREVALANAALAEPILWSFQVSAAGTLLGTKRTLIPTSENPAGAEMGTQDARWTKK